MEVVYTVQCIRGVIREEDREKEKKIRGKTEKEKERERLSEVNASPLRSDTRLPHFLPRIIFCLQR